MPSEKDLEFCFQDANKRKVVIEMPWGQEGKTAYLLVVQPGAETVWSMYEGEVPSEEPLWRHATRDVTLIHSLVFQSVPDDMVSVAPVAAAPTAGNQSVITGMYNISNLPPPDQSKASLQGRLENMQPANLVQSIQMAKMSGRLQVFEQGSMIQIYFNEGTPVHATSPDGRGDSAVIEMMMWETGEFRFFPEETTPELSVTRRMDSMLMEGITLLDQHKFLLKQGLKDDSYLVRKEARISPEEFKAKVSRGAPLDLQPQMSMYEVCDGKTRWADLLGRRPMMKTEWVPVLFNLVSCGLLSVSDTNPFAGKAQGLVGTELDRNMIAGVLRALQRSETGMYTFPALQYFLEREFSKSTAFGMPLSIVVFESRIILDGSPTPQPLPIPALREITNRVDSIRRPFDILAHYETFDFAVLLPGASGKAARMVGHKIAELLLN
ncbi:MAG: DUF4388 domain-containing protein, partial [Candidatus Obscuribacterales bacterium]|nr:DUF4388 domain-containing protein [Candidatus Obscuribacterales bacterium]